MSSQKQEHKQLFYPPDKTTLFSRVVGQTRPRLIACIELLMSSVQICSLSKRFMKYSAKFTSYRHIYFETSPSDDFRKHCDKMEILLVMTLFAFDTMLLTLIQLLYLYWQSFFIFLQRCSQSHLLQICSMWEIQG